jgi:hypothetical protein
MLDPRLTESSKQAMYLNLLFKAIKADTSIGRVMAFVKRLLQIMTLHQPPFICGAMFLLGEVSTVRLKQLDVLLHFLNVKIAALQQHRWSPDVAQ